MKMVLVAYNEALDGEMAALLERNRVEGFTKWTRVFGQGRTSGPHLGTHVWPKANNLLAVVTDDDTARSLCDGVRELRKRLGRKGVKAFLIPCEEAT